MLIQKTKEKFIGHFIAVQSKGLYLMPLSRITLPAQVYLLAFILILLSNHLNNLSAFTQQPRLYVCEAFIGDSGDYRRRINYNPVPAYNAKCGVFNADPEHTFHSKNKYICLC